MLVGEIGEEKLLEEIESIFSATSGHLPVPIGDDGAVIDCASGSQQVWTTDLLIEGIHFQRQWQSASQLGRKSLAVNLSDLAAMGAEPTTALISLAFEEHTTVEEITGICRGISEMAREHDVAVAGGDLSASRHSLMLSVAAGGTVSSGSAVLRSGANPGDSIFVTGSLGSAAAGLRLMLAGAGTTAGYDELRLALLEPEPRCLAGKAMAAAGATSMTDISDGLATDLRHICKASGTGALVEQERLPISGALVNAAVDNGWDLQELSLTGGEDYELLFTADDEECADAIRRFSVESGLDITPVGKITDASEGMVLVATAGKAIEFPVGGYEHFAGNHE